jgi:hypothetical protein
MPDAAMIIVIVAVLFHPAVRSGATGGQDTVMLEFSDFSVQERFHGKPVAVDFSSNPQTKTYRTRLRDGAMSGPNFAGHYTIVIWGCGTACQQFAIVDASTGKVFFSKDVPYVSFGDRPGEPYGLQFRANSRLLAVYGHIREDDPKGIFFYTWDGVRLTLVKSIPQK